MDFIDQIQQISARLKDRVDKLETEEATKNAAVMPVLNALGYDVFDPSVVVPEFTADVATKKGEKVDYAIMRDGSPIILFECKSAGSELSTKHAGQLFRYFSVTEARLAVLTNGIIYRFFTDIERDNRMDERPFFEFNLLDFDAADVEELKKFSRASFDLEDILSNASELKYKKQLTAVLRSEFSAPSEDFVRRLTAKVYDGRFTPQVRDRFTALVSDACREFIKSAINSRLESALRSGGVAEPVALSSTGEDADSKEDSADGIVTTEEELEAFQIVRAIMSKHVQADRVVMRDTKSYCGILLDDNNRKPICRLLFNGSQKYLGVFTAPKNLERFPIERPADIVMHEDSLVKTLGFYGEVAGDDGKQRVESAEGLPSGPGPDLSVG
jgi:hypothetical protein